MLTIDMKKCNRCTICAVICPNRIIGEENGLPLIRSELEVPHLDRGSRFNKTASPLNVALSLTSKSSSSAAPIPSLPYPGRAAAPG